MHMNFHHVHYISVTFPSGNEVRLSDEMNLDSFIEICRAYHRIFEDYPERKVRCVQGMRKATKFLADNWACQHLPAIPGSGDPVPKQEMLCLQDAKRIVEEGLDW